MAQRKEKELPAGQRLVAMMTERTPPIRLARLARDIDVSGTTIGRWVRELDKGTLDEDNWSRMAITLRDKYEIAVEEIRPIRGTVATPTQVFDASLLQHLDVFDNKKTLEALVHILDGSTRQAARDLLLVVARDRLNRLK